MKKYRVYFFLDNPNDPEKSRSLGSVEFFYVEGALSVSAKAFLSASKEQIEANRLSIVEE